MIIFFRPEMGNKASKRERQKCRCERGALFVDAATHDVFCLLDTAELNVLPLGNLYSLHLDCNKMEHSLRQELQMPLYELRKQQVTQLKDFGPVDKYFTRIPDTVSAVFPPTATSRFHTHETGNIQMVGYVASGSVTPYMFPFPYPSPLHQTQDLRPLQATPHPTPTNVPGMPHQHLTPMNVPGTPHQQPTPTNLPCIPQHTPYQASPFRTSTNTTTITESNPSSLSVSQPVQAPCRTASVTPPAIPVKNLQPRALHPPHPIAPSACQSVPTSRVGKKPKRAPSVAELLALQVARKKKSRLNRDVQKLEHTSNASPTPTDVPPSTHYSSSPSAITTKQHHSDSAGRENTPVTSIRNQCSSGVENPMPSSGTSSSPPTLSRISPSHYSTSLHTQENDTPPILERHGLCNTPSTISVPSPLVDFDIDDSPPSDQDNTFEQMFTIDFDALADPNAYDDQLLSLQDLFN